MEKTKRKTGGIAKFQEMSKDWENNPKILRKIIENMSEKIDELQAKANISDEAIEAFQELIRNQCDEISALKEKVEFYNRLMSVVRVEIDTPECVEKQELQYMDECDIDLDEFSENGFKTYVCEKASAYDRLMSGGKKTLKEVANFLQRPIAIQPSRLGCIAIFANVPFLGETEWHGYWMSTIACDLDYTGDWKDSLTFPDGWEEK